MKVIWTKSRLPLSYIIRWFTGEPCSHLALVFNSNNGGIMFESNLMGTHIKFFKNAKKHCTIVHEMIVPMTSAQEDCAWDLMVDRFDDKPYDYMGALYLGLMKLRFRIFKTPISKVNKWQNKGAYFCDELYQILEIAGFKHLGVELGMKSPEDVWLDLSGTVSVDKIK